MSTNHIAEASKMVRRVLVSIAVAAFGLTAAHCTLNFGSSAPKKIAGLIRTNTVVRATAAPTVVHPANPSDGGTYKNYSSLPLFGPGGPIQADIRQGQVGDCYFLANLGAIAKVCPSALSKIIVQDGPNAYHVIFQRSGFETVVCVNADLPSIGDQVYDGVIWAPIAEKAYAYFRTGANTYASLNLGPNNSAFYDLGFSNQVWTVQLSGWQAAANALAINMPASVITKGAEPPGSLITPSHSYSVDSVLPLPVTAASQPTLFTPWGWYPAAVKRRTPADGLITLTQTQAQADLATITACMAFTPPVAWAPTPTPPPAPPVNTPFTIQVSRPGGNNGCVVVGQNIQIPPAAVASYQVTAPAKATYTLSVAGAALTKAPTAIIVKVNAIGVVQFSWTTSPETYPITLLKGNNTISITGIQGTFVLSGLSGK